MPKALEDTILARVGLNGRILIIGDVMLDVIVKPEGPIVLGSDRRSRIETHPGGSAANQAAWIAHWGGDVTLAAKIGRDDAEVHRAAFVGSGVTPILAIDAISRSGVLVTLIGADGQRSFLTDRGANETLDANDLPDCILDGVSILHLSGYSFFAPRPREAVSDLVRRAKSKGVFITVDPASAGFLAEHSSESFYEWSRGASICFPNSDEARALTGSENLGEQRKILTSHYPIVVIKRGERGAEICTGDGDVLLQAPAPGVETVDTTGAGDAFVAGFLTAINRRKSLAQALDCAIAAGSNATTIFGGRPRRRGTA